ncbi:MAG: discoidin domain-containing protein [Oscillospiraceae bacterium]
MPAVFDMKIYDKHDGAETSAEVHEGLLDSEDSFKPAAPVNPIVKPENLALNKGVPLTVHPPISTVSHRRRHLTETVHQTGRIPAIISRLIQVDLGEKTDVNGLWISQWSNRIKYFKIHVSDDGRNWATAFYGRVTDAAELPTATELSIAFPTVKTRFVRFTITDGVYDEPNKQLFNIPIYEIEVYSSDNWQSSENVIDVETEKPTRETLNALREILQRIESLDEAIYTEKSFEALKRVYLKAKEYENGDVGNNTAVLEIIEELKQAEKDLIPISTYNELRDQLKEILQMDPSKYHTDDWNSLMLLTEYANVLLQQGNADTADVSFYVKSIDILLSSMRMADEENLEYIYEVNPAKSDEYLKEEIVIDGYDKDPVATGETNFVIYAILSAVLSLSAIIVIRKKSTR